MASDPQALIELPSLTLLTDPREREWITMTPEETAAVQRDGLALVMAALRDDVEAMAQLLTTSTPREVMGMAAFCARFAANKCREQQNAPLAGDLEHAFHAVALQLASKHP